ncbi:predicted protein [Naegleria gruberi]|uniref:Predicted protein n=1 Tax=Naegleria gruberi TaxID=5762 RepID=D2VQZ5_NAEGR|nr:uncharacterized protein NAEGRDRAFT_71401 [Naegleria gruberi]EFC40799.1 predicted protein [Naegleria gruberi]|eukprot:XP_002673543.1 predicted protein [Naegleria gruberi strain NEG-M]
MKLLTFAFLLLLVAQIIAANEFEISFQVPTNLLEKTSFHQVSNETFFSPTISQERDVQQCTCPACGCNGQACPKAADGWVVLSSMESCSISNQVPSISLVNIQSTSQTTGFVYYLVDEENKNKAMANQGFSFNGLKSYNSNFLTCTSNPTEGVRFPSKVPGKAYLIAQTRASTSLRFNIQMSCVRPKFTKFAIGAFPTNLAMKHVPYFFYGQEISFEVRLLDQFNELDTLQKGEISFEGGTFGDYQTYHDIVGGSTILKFTPTMSSGKPYSIKFSALTSADQDVPNIPLPSFSLSTFTIERGTITVQKDISENTPFKISFTLFNGQYEVTPGIDIKKLSFYSSSGTVLCEQPILALGSSSVQCTLKLNLGKSRYNEMILRYDNSDIATDTSYNVRSESDRYVVSVALLALLVLLNLLIC